MATDPATLIRRDLEWFRKSREEWRLAYQEAVKERRQRVADMCLEHTSTFDYLIQRAEDFLKRDG